MVDNGSADDSQAVVREQYPWVHLLGSSVNLGFAGGNNLALQALGFHPRGDEAAQRMGLYLFDDAQKKELYSDQMREAVAGVSTGDP